MIKVIITGATGMVGEGVLHECLQHPQVEAILVVGRKPCGVSHRKLKEILHADSVFHRRGGAAPVGANEKLNYSIT